MQPSSAKLVRAAGSSRKSRRSNGGASGPAGPVDSAQSECAARDERGCQQFSKKPHAPDDRQHGTTVAECGDLARVEPAQRQILKGPSQRSDEQAQTASATHADRETGAKLASPARSRPQVGAKAGSRPGPSRRAAGMAPCRSTSGLLTAI